jgi:hypothetical protein
LYSFDAKRIIPVLLLSEAFLPSPYNLVLAACGPATEIGSGTSSLSPSRSSRT